MIKLCVFLSLQDHFEQSQFEEIARSSAGGKKLKPNAIPTLFSFGEPPYPAITSPYMLLPMKSEPGMGMKMHLLCIALEDEQVQGSEGPTQSAEESQVPQEHQQYRVEELFRKIVQIRFLSVFFWTSVVPTGYQISVRPINMAAFTEHKLIQDGRVGNGRLLRLTCS